MVKKGDGNVSHQKRGNSFIHPALDAQRANCTDPKSAKDHACQHHKHHAKGGRHPNNRRAHHGRRQAAQHNRSLAADNDQPQTCGQRHTQRGKDQRCDT